MRVAGRLLLGCLVCFAVSGLSWSAVAFGSDSSSAEGLGGSSSLGGSLVIPSSPTEAEQRHAQEEARRSSPEAVASRAESQTKYEGLDSEQAAKLEVEAFPEVFGHPAGALPPLPAGQRVVGYPPADNAAQVELPEGKHGVIESMEPIAIETSPGHREPLDLSLAEVGDVFQPERSGVGVRIPKQLANGVELTSTGVSLTPIDEHGSALGGSEGVVDGATVLYANTQTDTDTVVKPLTSGFEEYTLLRSVESPRQLFFRVGLPQGASLAQPSGQSGVVEVLEAGKAIATISSPTAQDDTGTQVPVSMSVAGSSTLTLSVDEHAGEYQYPIAVDPTVTDKEISYQRNWAFYNGGNSSFEGSGGIGGLQDVVATGTGAGQRAFFYYPTQGESRIYAVTAYTSNTSACCQIENALSIWNVHSGSSEGSQSQIGPYERGGGPGSLCALSECATGSVSSLTDKTEVLYIQDTREAISILNSVSKLESADVSIVQEASPSSSFVPIEHWVKPNHETVELELNATDPGIGISGVTWSSPSWVGEGTNPFTFCSGVQCTACWTTSCSAGPLKVNLKGLPDGEDEITSTVSDYVKLTSTAKTKVKIDNAPPYNITLSGLPASGEIGFAHYLLKASATDGSGTTPSSGIASIALAVDGKTVGSPKGFCSPGPCTTTGEWMLNGEEYVAGKHVLTVTATDGAGNVETKEFTFVIESTETKPLGPGSVDLTSGGFGLSATDVSIGSPGSPLTIKRSYNSRHLTAGAEGPLGPQWSGLGLGGTQSLTALPTGSLLLTAADGRQSLFAKEGTKFLAPPGDTNLTLKEEGTNIFKLTDQHGDVTTFTVPSGGSGTLLTPSAIEEVGSIGSTKSTFQTVGGITEPTQVLAPVPAGVSCTTLVKGCRALTFGYATSTTATGQNESQWGEYTGRLTHIYLTAWEPIKKEMATTAVAQYAYDNSGRLRAEWDPRISPALKTTYGYDVEGHVVSMTQPGQETWVFTYSALTGDSTTGRLIKAAQASASAPLWNGEALTSTEVPKLTGSPTVGIRMTTSDGVWTNSPVSYSYQWEDCNPGGSECTPIYGATNPNYTPVSSDLGHTIVAVVTAMNGDGSLSASSAKSGLVRTPGAPEYVSSIGTWPSVWPYSLSVNSKGDVFVEGGTELNEKGELVKKLPGVAGRVYTMDSKGDVWSASTDVTEYNEEGKLLAEYQKTPEYPCTELENPAGIAVDKEGNIWVTNTGRDEVEELKSNGACIKVLGREGTGNGEYKSPSGIAIDSSSHVWIADKGNNRVQELEHSGTYKAQFGTVGEGNGQFKAPTGLMIDSKGDIWVADTGNGRVQEFNEEGKKFVVAVGSKGEGNGQFVEPTGMVLDLKSNLWVADAGGNRVEKFNLVSGKYVYSSQSGSEGSLPNQFERAMGVATDLKGHEWVVDERAAHVDEYNEAGEYMRRFGTKGTGGAGQLWNPHAVAVDQKGNVWVGDGYGHIQEFNEEGKYLSEFSTPEGAISIAVDSKGNIWITGGEHVDQFSPEGKLLTQFSGADGCTRPEQIAVDSKNNIWVSYDDPHCIQKFTEKGELLINVSAPLGEPRGLATDTKNNLWLTDYEGGSEHPIDSVVELNEKGEKVAEFGTKGYMPGQFDFPNGIAIDSKSNIWVVDTGNARVGHFSIVLTEPGEARSPAPGWTVSYRVPVSSAGAPYNMSTAEIEKWAQKDVPAEATAIFPPDEPQNSPPTDYKRATIYYLDNRGQTVNVASPGGGISTTEYNTPDDIVRTLSPDNRTTALKQSCESSEKCKSAEVAKVLSSESTYNSEGTELVSTLGPQHTIKLASGSTVEARDHQQYYYEEGAPTEGGPYRLVTKVTDGAQYSGKEEDVRTTTTSYAGQSNLGWKLRKPTSVTTDPSGLKLTHTTLYEASTGETIETRMPASTGENSPHDTQTIYYTTAANSKYKECGEHAEWANLLCRTQPAKQPETSGVPNLPVTVVTYNMWDEPETTTETVGTTKRTKTVTYDAAGRLKTSAISSTVGTALPVVTDEYSAETGAPVKQCANEGKPCTEGKPKTITSVYNTLGELTSYTDADENTATYEYDVDGRTTKANDGKGTQTYTYDPTTGDLTKLVDSAAGTFTGVYDVEGNLLTEGYPNGMNANYTYDQTGKSIGLEYVKTTHCTEKCTWFSDAVVPSIHGQWLEQTSTLSHQAYTYDAAGRLTQVQNTPAGKGCTTRVYAYDEDTNRLSLKTHEPGSKGECTSTGGTEEKHTYDSADRLTDTGVKYSEVGNITALPAADAGGSELTSTYYTDNQLASETQNGQTIGYNLDPAGRTLETVATGKRAETVTNHYAGPSSAPAWTVNTAGETTRNIAGISGFTAVQHSTETPVLQLTNLHGDIIGTAYLSETATGLASSADTSEFGVPTTSLPPKYSWLGADEIPTELPSGVLDMGARSYVPQLGRFLQPDPQPGGSANAYTYTFGDPVNASDPGGEYTVGGPSQSAIDGTARMATEAAAEQAAINAAARAEAERKEREALAAVDAAAGPQYEGEEEEWYEEEEYEEEGEYEYASYHPETKDGKEEIHIEPAVLVQRLVTETAEGHEGGNESATIHGSTVPLCKANVQGPCARLARGGEGTHKRHKSHWSKTACQYMDSAAGGIAGTAIGSAGGPVGAFAGGLIGSAVGELFGEATCQ